LRAGVPLGDLLRADVRGECPIFDANTVVIKTHELFKVHLIRSVATANFVTVLLKVRTLFVSGLPMDAKPRELHLLFRAYKVNSVGRIHFSKESYIGLILIVKELRFNTANVRYCYVAICN